MKQNAGLDEAKTGIILLEEISTNFIYTNDTTLMVEVEEEQNSLLMNVKEESENAGLKLNIQKTRIMLSSPITSWQIDGEKVEIVIFYFLGLQNHCGW